MSAKVPGVYWGLSVYSVLMSASSQGMGGMESFEWTSLGTMCKIATLLTTIGVCLVRLCHVGASKYSTRRFFTEICLQTYKQS